MGDDAIDAAFDELEDAGDELEKSDDRGSAENLASGTAGAEHSPTRSLSLAPIVRDERLEDHDACAHATHCEEAVSAASAQENPEKPVSNPPDQATDQSAQGDGVSPAKTPQPKRPAFRKPTAAPRTQAVQEVAATAAHAPPAEAVQAAVPPVDTEEHVAIAAVQGPDKEVHTEQGHMCQSERASGPVQPVSHARPEHSKAKQQAKGKPPAAEREPRKAKQQARSKPPAPECNRPTPPDPAKAAARKKPTTPRAKTAFMFFQAEQRPNVVAEHPDMKFGEVAKLLGEMWKNLSPEAKGPYLVKQETDKERVARETNEHQTAAAGGDECPDPCHSSRGVVPSETGDKPKGGSKRATSKIAVKPKDSRANEQTEQKPKKQRGRSRKQRKVENCSDAELPENTTANGDTDYDWEHDHEAVDWKQNPAEYIVAMTSKKKYVVKRKGLPLHEYGLVDSNEAKRQCTEHTWDSWKPGCVTAPMVNDFERCRKSFERDTLAHMISNELDLDELSPGSLLEMCSFLGDMRREGLLDRKGCNFWSFPDERMNVPIMMTSFIFQRMLHCERQQADALRGQLEKAHTEIQYLKQGARLEE